jgi:hypothetical protein
VRVERNDTDLKLIQVNAEGSDAHLKPGILVTEG